MVKKTIAECKIDGTQAHSFVSDDYLGSCVLSYESNSFNCENKKAIFVDYAQAKRAASWAVDTNKGGYSEVTVEATEQPPEFMTAEEWFFD